MAAFSLHILSLLLLIPLLATSKTSPADTSALTALKAALNPASITPGSCLSSWDLSLDPCDSAFGDRFTCGIRCDANVRGLLRVTDLTLDPAGYEGPLSAAVWSLAYLESLHLADNRLSGTVPPPPAGALPASLRRITLSRNSFSGELPAIASAPALEELSLDGNEIQGEIPVTIAQLVKLQRVELQGNNFTGGLPDLRPLTSLYFLDASDNLLTGGFPGASSLPGSLIEISLRSNRLEGWLAGADVAGLPALQVMDLSRNRFTGPVPAAVFEHESLEQLALAYNEFEWVEQPADGGAGSGLVALDLGHNRLKGPLPRFLGAMNRLSAVDLQDNMFTGMIPTEYAMRAAAAAAGEGDVAPFGRLILAGNYLFGPIPSPLGVMKEGSATVSLADNCLWRCPIAFFFCQGGEQKAPAQCRGFNPMIP